MLEPFPGLGVDETCNKVRASSASEITRVLMIGLRVNFSRHELGACAAIPLTT